MRRIYHLCGTPAKSEYPEPNHEETTDKPKLRGILQNSWPVLFKNFSTVKDKKNENLFLIKEDCKENYQLNAMIDSRLNEGEEYL